MTTTKQRQQQRRTTLRPHPARDQILDVMRSYDRPISPTQLSKVTSASLGSVAYHVRTLVSAGVIELAGEGRVRGAVEHFYALVPQNDVDLVDPAMALLRLCGLLTLPSPDGGYPRPVSMDEQAQNDLLTLVDKVRPKVRTIVLAAAKRTATS
jgi:hypothetical protein